MLASNNTSGDGVYHLPACTWETLTRESVFIENTVFIEYCHSVPALETFSKDIPRSRVEDSTVSCHALFGRPTGRAWGRHDLSFQTAQQSGDVKPFKRPSSRRSLAAAATVMVATALETVAAMPTRPDTLRTGNKVTTLKCHKITRFDGWQFTLQMRF